LFALANKLIRSISRGNSNHNVAISGGGSTYTGSLDINSTNIVAWWGLRCPSVSYPGNLFMVTDSATSNTTASKATCSGGVVSFATGANCAGPAVSGNTCSPLATTCSSACNVYELFDASGQSNCSGPCNATQATNASRPTLLKVAAQD
jgi:hypothetical protein